MAQLVEVRAAMWEVLSSTPAGPIGLLQCWRASSLLFPHWDIKTQKPGPVELDLPLF